MTATLVFASTPPRDHGVKYRAITRHNIADVPQTELLKEHQRLAIDVVSRVLPFKTNNYVVNELINWDDVPTIRYSR